MKNKIKNWFYDNRPTSNTANKIYLFFMSVIVGLTWGTVIILAWMDLTK